MQSTIKGVFWSAVERFSVQGVQFLLTLVIARLVTPDEYGLVAMLAIFMAIAQIFIDSGFGSALIQKKDRTEIDFSTVFYFNMITCVLLYVIIFFCSPLIAKFYNQPELTIITRFIGINLILMSLSIVQRTRLTIDLDFKLQSKVSLIAVLVSGALGIFTAYHGWGVWALVTQTLANNFIQTLLFWVLTRWTPLFAFSVRSFKTLFAFGSKLLASALLHTIYLNLYSLVIGKFYNPSDVGYYNRAYSISQYPSTNIVMVLTRAIYPVQCEHQSDDEWLERTFTSYLRMACYIVFPLMCLLAVLAKPLVLLALTEKWLPSALLITILSIAYMWYPVMVVNNQMLTVKGRSDLFLQAEVIKKIVAILILIATIPFGLIWLCVGVLIYNLFDMFLIIRYTKIVVSIGYWQQIRDITPIFFITVISSLLSFLSLLLTANSWLQLIIGSFVFSATYFLSSKIFRIQELSQLVLICKKFKNRN